MGWLQRLFQGHALRLTGGSHTVASLDRHGPATGRGPSGPSGTLDTARGAAGGQKPGGDGGQGIHKHAQALIKSAVCAQHAHPDDSPTDDTFRGSSPGDTTCFGSDASANGDDFSDVGLGAPADGDASRPPAGTPQDTATAPWPSTERQCCGHWTPIPRQLQRSCGHRRHHHTQRSGSAGHHSQRRHHPIINR